jgi:hypothetical protein
VPSAARNSKKIKRNLYLISIAGLIIVLGFKGKAPEQELLLKD